VFLDAVAAPFPGVAAAPFPNAGEMRFTHASYLPSAAPDRLGPPERRAPHTLECGKDKHPSGSVERITMPKRG
jgi:hypothetical protein